MRLVAGPVSFLGSDRKATDRSMSRRRGELLAEQAPHTLGRRQASTTRASINVTPPEKHERNRTVGAAWSPCRRHGDAAELWPRHASRPQRTPARAVLAQTGLPLGLEEETLALSRSPRGPLAPGAIPCPLVPGAPPRTASPPPS